MIVDNDVPICMLYQSLRYRNPDNSLGTILGIIMGVTYRGGNKLWSVCIKLILSITILYESICIGFFSAIGSNVLIPQ